VSAFLGLFVMPADVSSQSKNVDSLLVVARQAANAGDRDGAVRTCTTIVELSPSYWDARLLLARVYLWDKKYDLAQNQIREVFDAKPDYFEAWDLQTDLLLWSGKYAACLNACQKALSYFHDNKQFLLKKAKSYTGLQKPELADETLLMLLAVDPQNGEALKLRQSLQPQLYKNRLSVSYSYDYYANRVLTPWQALYILYARKIPIGTLIGRVNYARRFDMEGVQGEADAYLKLSNWNYVYLNLGYSNQAVFPRFRMGGEFYQKIPSAFEASAGFRYLKYASTDVVIYTAYLGKYMGNWWVSGRGYFKLQGNTSLTLLAQTRYYYASRDDYWGLRLNYGISPDERSTVLTAVASLTSTGVRLEYSRQMSSRFTLNVAAMYNNTEWTANRYRNVFSGEAIVSYRF
jgi:YaiO family outer membrane protein